MTKTMIADESSREPRMAIGTVVYRAEDLLNGDIAQLRLHGQIRWVAICQDVKKSLMEQVSIAYTNSLGSYSSIDMGRYELVKVQITKEPK